MTTGVSEKLPYEPIKPIEIEKEPCPICCKVMSVFFYVIALTGFGICFGVAGAMLAKTSTIIVEGLIGGVVGLAAGIALSILQKRTSPAVKYRMQTLEQLSKVIVEPKVLSALEAVKEVIKEENFTYDKTLDKHMECIVEALPKERPDIIKVWNAFAEHVLSISDESSS